MGCISSMWVKNAAAASGGIRPSVPWRMCGKASSQAAAPAAEAAATDRRAGHEAPGRPRAHNPAAAAAAASSTNGNEMRSGSDTVHGSAGGSTIQAARAVARKVRPAAARAVPRGRRPVCSQAAQTAPRAMRATSSDSGLSQSPAPAQAPRAMPAGRPRAPSSRRSAQPPDMTAQMASRM